MFNYPPVDAYAEFIYFCGVFPPTTIYVYNPNPTSIYTWSTINGNIVGSNVGTSIVVDAPGTYLVIQQLHAQCLAYSRDSVVMMFDSVCTVLDVNLVSFDVKHLNNNCEFKWQVANNSEATNFEIEISYDNINFIKVATINAGVELNVANYTYRYPFIMAAGQVVFYRIKINSKSQKYKYSHVVTLRSAQKFDSDVNMFPNPTTGEIWLTYTSSSNQTAEVNIWNLQGKLINFAKLQIVTGENLLNLPGLYGKPSGIYIVRLKLETEKVIRKIIKIN